MTELDLGVPEELRGSTSWGQLYRPRADVFVTRLRGRVDESIVHAYARRADLALGRGLRLSVFHDWAEVDGYDPEARRAYRDWGAQHRDAFAARVYLIRSKILSMALSAAAVALRIDVTVHARREAFDEALRAAVARPTVRPPG